MKPASLRNHMTTLIVIANALIRGWQQGDEPADVAIRRLRDDDPTPDEINAMVDEALKEFKCGATRPVATLWDDDDE